MQSRMSYTQIGFFSIAAYPYSLKARGGPAAAVPRPVAPDSPPCLPGSSGRGCTPPPPITWPSSPSRHPSSAPSWCPSSFLLQLLWSPIVDSIYSTRFGRRKSWIVPLQAASAVVMIVGGGAAGAALEQGQVRLGLC
jgi:hypothetical protein